MEMKMDASEAEEWTKNDKNFFFETPCMLTLKPPKELYNFCGSPGNLGNQFNQKEVVGELSSHIYQY